MNQDLKKLKKIYGEKFAKLCRTLFPTLLETEGLLSQIITSKFAPSHSLYETIALSNENIEQFKDYIYSFANVEKETKKVQKYASVRELLNEAGYDFYECKSEEDIQSFKKYYEPSEELCTFRGGRLETCHVFWAVKKDVDQIKREDFPNPTREDKYGTSVISIQFSRKDNSLSIKNRYNHHVNNPDATFSNNLDNIIDGLARAFEFEYNLKQNFEERPFNIPGFIKGNDGKYYKYNYEIGGIYYCEDNKIIEYGTVIDLNNEQPNRYILFDYFILDKKEKRIYLYDAALPDCFVEGLRDLDIPRKDANGKIQTTKIEETVDKINETRIITIKPVDGREPIIIKLDKRGKIIGYSNSNLNKIGNCFLYDSTAIKEIDLPNVKTIGHNFLSGVKYLGNYEDAEKIVLPKLEKAGSKFLYNLKRLKKLELPNIKKIDGYFLANCESLKELKLPKLEVTGSYFLSYCEDLEEIYLPELKEAGEMFLHKGIAIKLYDYVIFGLAEIEKIKKNDEDQRKNKNLRIIYIPSLTNAPDYIKEEINEYKKRLSKTKQEFFDKETEQPKKEKIISKLRILKKIATKLKLIKNNIPIQMIESEQSEEINSNRHK